MLNKELINRKFDLIIKDIKLLKPLGGLGIEKYLDKIENEVLAERYLEKIISRVIDVNYHLVKEIGGFAPTEYGQSFKDLARLKILPADFAFKIAKSAGLRNILVHHYDEIDETQIYENIKSCLQDVPKYMGYVKKFVKEYGSKKA